MRTLTGFLLATVLAVPGALAQTPDTAAQALVTVEHEWSQAVVNRDVSALDRFYADEYILTNEDGAIFTKAKEIADIRSGSFRLTSFAFADLEVRLYGDVAVVTGQNTITGRWDGIDNDISGPYRFTDVFVNRNGRWQCVVSQSSRITPAAVP